MLASKAAAWAASSPRSLNEQKLSVNHLLQQFPVVRGLACGLGLAAALIAHGMLDALRLGEERGAVALGGGTPLARRGLARLERLALAQEQVDGVAPLGLGRLDLAQHLLLLPPQLAELLLELLERRLGHLRLLERRLLLLLLGAEEGGLVHLRLLQLLVEVLPAAQDVLLLGDRRLELLPQRHRRLLRLGLAPASPSRAAPRAPLSAPPCRASTARRRRTPAAARPPPPPPPRCQRACRRRPRPSWRACASRARRSARASSAGRRTPGQGLGLGLGSGSGSGLEPGAGAGLGVANHVLEVVRRERREVVVVAVGVGRARERAVADVALVIVLAGLGLAEALPPAARLGRHGRDRSRILGRGADAL
eukprot:scaffold107566_cov69-Phaeocystis_antarctica.AAC.2